MGLTIKLTAFGAILVSLALTANARQLAGSHDHGSHDHGSKSNLWEWAGVFDFHGSDEALYTFIASVKSGGGDGHEGHNHRRALGSGHAHTAHAKYPDESMVVLVLPTTKGNADGIHAVEDRAKGLYNVSGAIPYTDAGISPGVSTVLTFDDKSPVCYFKFKVETDGPHVIFAQHFAIEFEGWAGHYLKDHKGNNIEPLAEEPAKKEGGLPGTAILASFIVLLVTFSGLLLLYPFIKAGKISVEDQGSVARIGGMFAAGALLSTAFIFIFPEALHSFAAAAKEDKTAESEIVQASGLGGSALAGILTGVIIALSFKIFCEDPSKSVNVMDAYDSAEKDKPVPEKSGSALFDATKRPFCELSIQEWTGTAWSVVVGDFLHNFVDGVAIGIAFMSCDATVGWTVAAGTIGHEVAQEVADFMVLITRGKMSIGAAILLNFISGLSCVIGALVATGGNLTNSSTGVLLGFSGGIYSWIAVGECLSVAVQHAKSWRDVGLYSVSFVIGAVAIGVVLVNHVHCGDHGH